MRLMATKAIGTIHGGIVPLMAIETRGDRIVTAVAIDTILIMPTRICAGFGRNRLMATDTYRPLIFHSGQIINARLMGIMTIATATPGEMGISSAIMT